MLRALRRLVAYEGSIAAVARTLGMKRQRLSRWLARGIPARDLVGAPLEELLAVLYARFAQLDKDSKAAEARERKIQASKDAEELLRQFGDRSARKKLVGAIRAWVARYGEIARFRKLKRSGAQWFADELGVRVELVRAAVRPGEESMSVKLFQAFRQFEEEQRSQAIEDAIDRGKMEELMELAGVPATTTRMEPRWRKVREGGRLVRKKVMVPVEYDEPVTPKIAGGSWEFSGEGTHGRRWGMPIGKFLSPRIHPSGRDGWKIVEEFVAFARGVPGLSPSWRYPEWNVYALASELGEKQEGSKQQYRDLDHEDARNFVVSEAYSGGNRRGPGARERSISSSDPTKKGFIQHIGKALDGTNLLFLHGGIAWNFRRRDEEERKRIEKSRRETREMQKTVESIRARNQAVAQKKKAKRVRRKTTLAAVMARRAEKKGSRS